jgi:hypothetical protein
MFTLDFDVDMGIAWEVDKYCGNCGHATGGDDGPNFRPLF